MIVSCSTHFHLTPPKHVDLFTVSVNTQARLTRKIVGSYSRVFTVLSTNKKTVHFSAGLSECYCPNDISDTEGALFICKESEDNVGHFLFE